MNPFNNEVIADSFVPLHSSQLMWYQVTLCTDGWWNPSSICKVHPCFLSQTFYLEILFGKLPKTLPSCSKYIFPIYLIWPFYKKKKKPAKCLLIWHKKCSRRLKQVLGSWPKIYKNFILDATILDYFTQSSLISEAITSWQDQNPQSLSTDSLTLPRVPSCSYFPRHL